MKRCGKCGTERDESEFHRDKSKKDGLCSRCKQCMSEHDRLKRIENKDIIFNRNKEYKLENRLFFTEYYREYYKEARVSDPTKYANKNKAWKQKNKESVRESKLRFKLKSRHPMKNTTITDPILMGKIIDMKQLGMRVCDIAPKLSMESGKRITQSAIWRLFDSLKEEPIPELLESDYPSLEDISYIFNIKFKKEKTATVITYRTKRKTPRSLA